MIINAQYPCCKGQARLKVFPELPKQRYQRICPVCGKVWEVEHRPVSKSLEGILISIVEWE